jgi:hypothetical protein
MVDAGLEAALRSVAIEWRERWGVPSPGPARACPECHDYFLPEPDQTTSRCHECERRAHPPRQEPYC